MANMWVIRNDALDQELLDEGFVSLGWDEIPDLRDIGRDRTRIKELLSGAYPEAKGEPFRCGPAFSSASLSIFPSATLSLPLSGWMEHSTSAGSQETTTSMPKRKCTVTAVALNS